MKKIDIFEDLLLYKKVNQVEYNLSAIEIRNPEARQIFVQMRDEELRDITMLQQKIHRIKSPAGIIAKLLPTKKRY